MAPSSNWYYRSKVMIRPTERLLAEGNCCLVRNWLADGSLSMTEMWLHLDKKLAASAIDTPYFNGETQRLLGLDRGSC